MKAKDFKKYDVGTQTIVKLLSSFPKPFGDYLSRFYLWKPSMFNYMLVGASGTVLNWVLYELIVRPIVAPFFMGTFLGIVLVTILVFLWNYSLNKSWSLKASSQIFKMKDKDLSFLHDMIHKKMKGKKEFKKC